MRRHTADVQARRQDGGAGRALRHLGDPVGKFFPLKILAGILYFPVPGVEKKKKLPVPRVTEISTVHLFISNLTRAVWGLSKTFDDTHLSYTACINGIFVRGNTKTKGFWITFQCLNIVVNLWPREFCRI